MLNMQRCREFLNLTGHSLSTLDIPSLDVDANMRDFCDCTSTAVSRNNLNLLFLPCATYHYNTVMYMYSLSQREGLDQHKSKTRNAATGLRNYGDEATVIAFVNFKSINAENRAALKEYITTEFGNAEVVNSRYMVVHPQCDVAVYKFPNNKFLVLTNTFTTDFMQAVYTMLWINHDHSTATPEMADALLRGDEETIVAYINSLIAARAEGIGAKRFAFFTDKFKGIMTYRNKTAAIERTLNTIRSEIERLNSKLLEQYAKRKVALGKMLQLQSDTQDSTVDDLLLMIKPEDIVRINQDESSDTQVYFVMKSRFTYWDAEDYKIMRDRRTRNTNFLSGYDDTFIRFLDKIFVDKEYTLLFNTPLCLYTYDNGSGVLPCITRGNQRDSRNLLANPHIYHYNCWGDNGGLIAQAFEAGDFITAWGTILSAISAVSISDTPVMTRLIGDLYNYAVDGYTCEAKQIVKSDGVALTIREAYEEYARSLTATPTVEPAAEHDPMENFL